MGSNVKLQINRNDSNIDRSFTVDDSNSFSSPLEILRENEYLGIF